jgi:putative transposase
LKGIQKKALFLYNGFETKTNIERRSAMKVDISVPEVVEIFKEMEKKPERLFEMIRVDVRESVGQYLSELMNKELSHFLGREPYERKQDSDNHRNGSYDRSFTLKGIGEVKSRFPGIGRPSLKAR